MTYTQKKLGPLVCLDVDPLTLIRINRRLVWLVSELSRLLGVSQ